MENVCGLHNLNMACSKDLYTPPNIDHVIDNAFIYKTLSFKDAFSGYNQIKMDPLDAPKTAFVTNNQIYHYKVMPFGLKNAGATFQCCMDTTFATQIGRNLEVCIDNLMVKTLDEARHSTDLEEIFQQVRKFDMRLNPANCSFGVQGGSLFRFITYQERY